ncbi:MAG: TIM barrel protein [Planctomycetia bacterium]
MRSAITISLVPEARQGPFVFHACDTPGGFESCCRLAAEIGFDAVEVFPEAAETLPRERLRTVLAVHGLAVAAVGTGAGWLRQQLHLCHADAAVRTRARAFIGGIIDAAGEFGAPAIIGSMQGRSDERVPRDAALDHLADGLGELGERAARHGQVLLYEPLNRYETNLFNRQADAAEFLAGRGIPHVKLLCDLFHMAIEEHDIAAALRACGGRVGHVHWADSNRRAIGFGHTDPAPIVAALEAIGYRGFLSAEVLPLPTAVDAARQSLLGFQAHTR